VLLVFKMPPQNNSSSRRKPAPQPQPVL